MDNAYKKAGVLTFHYADNYGAVLQAMSLNDYITSLGVESQVINYIPKYAKKGERFLLTDSLRHFVISLINLPSKIKKRIRFNRFRKRFLKCGAQTISSYELLNKAIESYDLIAFGSDQIWNPGLTGGIDRVYFGDWHSKRNQNKIAYAASIGVSNLTEDQATRIRSLASNLKSVGIREPEVESVIRRDTTVVCDPVLLNDAEYWRTVFPPQKKIKDHYILIYSLSGYPEVYKMANVIRNKTGLEVIEVRAGYKLSKQIDGEKIVKSLSPEAFVNAIDKADYVVTDSFHGTAFSLIFGKNVFVIPNKTKGGRMIHLLKRVGLDNRIVYDHNITADMDISMYDVDNVAANIKEFREQSQTFLKDAVAR